MDQQKKTTEVTRHGRQGPAHGAESGAAQELVAKLDQHQEPDHGPPPEQEDDRRPAVHASHAERDRHVPVHLKHQDQKRNQ